jgi:FkbH-like protein
MRVTVVLPTLPLPPAAHQRPDQMGKWESDLRLLVADFASRIAGLPNVAVLHPNTMDETSPVQNRRDLAMELRSGFPYTIPHADALAAAIARQATPRASLKALITDLDNTMWEGILGEDGVEAVHWDLHHGSHMHALYQQFLASLADAGIMIGVASKNPPELAHAALSRPDMHVRPEMIFPVEAGWNVKSQSIARILRAWNIAPDAVVFVDDSPLELEEVRAEFPDIQCRVFPAGDPRRIWDLLADLRGLFGRNHVTEEDSLRVQSLRTRAEFDALSHGADGTADFLETVQATIDLSFRKQPAESRAFELVNKTNQFNLNGRRYTTASWTSYLQHPRSFLVSATYRDKFGQLGQISVALGHQDGSTATIDAWVMSCRAFSRRIEHRILHELFECFQLDALRLNFEPTNRNGPLSEFFESVSGERQTGPFTLTRSAFQARCPTLHHVVAHEASVRTVQNEQ